MIYYCVKTSEYLADILDKVSRETQYYVQLDVPLDRAEGIIEKFQKRYDLDQTARQRNYRLKQKPVVDLVVLLNQSLLKIEKVRLCLLCTVISLSGSLIQIIPFLKLLNDAFSTIKRHIKLKIILRFAADFIQNIG